MRRFLVRITLFLTIQIAIAAAMLAGYRPDPLSFYASIRSKHAAARSAPSPRILLAGGSNVLFACDSQMIADATGRPTINLGLHADFGLDLVLNEIRALAKPGDIVILSTVPTVIDRAHPPVVYQAAEHELRLIRLLSIADLPMMLDELWLYSGRVFRARLCSLSPGYSPPRNAIYNAENIDARGDLRIPPELAVPATDPRIEVRLQIDFGPATQAAIRDLERDLAARDIALYYAAPATIDYVHEANRDAIARIEAAVSQAGVHVLVSGDVAAYPDDQFLDTAFHPLPDLRAQYTQTIIDALLAARPDLRSP